MKFDQQGIEIIALKILRYGYSVLIMNANKSNASLKQKISRKFPWFRFYLAIGLVLLHASIFFPEIDQWPPRDGSGVLYLVLQGSWGFVNQPVLYCGPHILAVLPFLIAYIWQVVFFIWFCVNPQKKLFLCFLIPTLLWIIIFLSPSTYA